MFRSVIFISAVIAVICQLPSVSAEPEEGVVDLEARVVQLEDKLRELEKKDTFAGKHDVANDVFAFTAVLSGDTNINTGATLVFDNIIYNIGTAYDSTTGVFTCPVAGIYQFSMSSVTDNGSGGTSQIMVADVGGQEIPTVAAYNSGGSWDSSSVTSTVQCNAGGRVWVKNAWNSGFTYRAIANNNQGGVYLTTFTGALLHQMF